MSVADPDASTLAAHHRHLTDAGNAELFCDLYRDLVRYDHARQRWLVWDSHRWRPDADATVYRMALNTTRTRLQAASDPNLPSDDSGRLAKFAIASETRSRQDSMLALARTMLPVADPGTGWDETPGLLGVPNGVVDLRSGELRDGRPDDRVTMQTAVPYDPAALDHAHRWRSFLAEVLVDPETVRYVQRLAGYSLTAEGTLHLLVFLMGVGRNGKSTLVDALSYPLGDYARSISPAAIMDARKHAHSTEVADLALSRFAYCEELPDDTLNAERLKALSGSARFRARRMRENTVEFARTWQLWFSTNGLPRSSDNSWGWWQRVRVIDFPRTFPADEFLPKQLRDEAEGILAWAVEGARFYYEEGLGDVPAAVAARTEQYREELDPLASLFNEGYLVRTDDQNWTPLAYLKKAYEQYADAHSWPAEKRWSDTYLGTLLSAQFGKQRRKLQEDGKTSRYWGYHGVMPGPTATFDHPTTWRYES